MTMMASRKVKTSPNLPAGATFRRCALQVNPYGYSRRFRGRAIEGDADSHAKAIVNKSVQLGISVLAITNHNDVGDVPAFRAAAKGTSVRIFPGFEIASSEGIHVLCIYPTKATQDQLNQYLGAIMGSSDPTATDSLSSLGFVQVLANVQKQGGVTVAAHVTSNSGLFEGLSSGKARAAAWRSEHLLAVQIPNGIDNLPAGLRQIVRNQHPEYQRGFRADNQAIAVLNAKDVVTADDLEDPASTCWIKMSNLTVESLRQAFLDPASRIRLSSDPQPSPHTEFLSMRWDGGFLGGTEFRFNENLNVLVGGRGAGKSTVIESLRYVLDLKPVGEDATKAHEGIIRDVLRPGTKLSLNVRSHRPNATTYCIERIVPNPPVVRLEDGTASNLHPTQIVGEVEVYGQNEIAEIAKNPDKRKALLERFVEPAQAASEKERLQHSLEGNRLAIVEVSKALANVDDQLDALPGLEETLERYRQAGLEERLLERSLVVREESLLNSIPERLEPFREALLQLTQSLPIDRTFLSERALESLPGAELIQPADRTLALLGERLAAIAKDFQEALRDAETEVKEIRAHWTTRKSEVESAYQSILRSLKQSAVDGEAFIRLRGDIENLRPLRERRSSLAQAKSEHLARRQALLVEWEEAQAEEGQALVRAAQKVSQRLQGRVRVDVQVANDRTPLFDLLREKVGGQLKGTIESLSRAPDLSLREFAGKCRSGTAELQKAYGLTPNQSQRIADMGEELFMRIEELELRPTIGVSLNVASDDDADWQKLENLSKGQKATAVLLLLLLESKAPLVIDQPEDDLDNRFIADSIVPRMREEKRNRQFVFSTHNANIPVLGDAEMILGITASGEAAGGQGRIPQRHMGSIDVPEVRRTIEELLEGGRDAFERRRRRYGF